MPEIVPKPWGYEYCAFDNGAAAVWILHIARGRKTSLHCHPRKRTRLVCLQGEVMFRMPPEPEALGGQTDRACRMRPLEMTDIQPGAWHQSSVSGMTTASENGAFVMEIEEPSDKADIVRWADDYGRAGKPIENYTVPCNTPMLALSSREQSLMGYRFKLESTLGGPSPDLALALGGEVLGIYRDGARRVADCVADFVKGLGIEHVFGVTGGGSMHLNDAFRDVFIANHHEQASAMAGEAYARLKGIGCALVTTGPGGTNTITGVACAWVDSIPVIFISGQVTRSTLMDGHGLRQLGVQESAITALVSSITKYAITVTDEKRIRYELEKAAHLARAGRPGPVWVDIPLDVQGAEVRWEELLSYKPAPRAPESWFMPHMAPSKRPLLVIGNGVHLARAEDDCRALVEKLGIPVVSSWTAADIMPSEHPLYIGRFGIFGDRAANFAVQNADVLLVLGSRLSVPQIGHNAKMFARGAKIIMVDADEREMLKPTLHVEHRVVADVGDFIRFALHLEPDIECAPWLGRCRKWKSRYSVVSSEKRDGRGVNSFLFVEVLSKLLPADAIVVTDMGTAFTCTFQAARMKAGQRWLTASGHAPMGYGLPGAIGAHYASARRVVCIVGDGGFQFNIQELQTIAHHKLPIVVFVLNNGGYLAMKHTQQNHFGRLVGSDRQSGLSCPDTLKIARAYGISAFRIPEAECMEEAIETALALAPGICEVMMPPEQPLIPRSSSMKLPDGRITSRPIEDLYPFLSREELKAEMVIPTVEVFQ